MATKHLVPWWRSESGLAGRDPFAGLQKEMNELLEKFFGGRAGDFEAFSPSVDVKENGKEVKLTVELPGMEEKDIDVSVSEGVLTLEGEKKQEKEEKGEETYRLERTYGSFRRDIALPCKVEVDKAKATFAKGVLTIVLPKAAEAPSSKKIRLEAA